MNSYKNKSSSLHVSICDFFRINLEELRSLAPDVRRNPSVRKIHKLRITIRKIRNTLAVLEIHLESARLKHLAKILGEIRDIDVAIRNSKRFTLQDKHLKRSRLSYVKKIKEKLRKHKVKEQIVYLFV